MLDAIDKAILEILQKDCTVTTQQIAKRVGLSHTPCWRRVKKLEQTGVIDRCVALLNAKKIQADTVIFVTIKTDQHNAEWLEKFATIAMDMPEVVELYRLGGDIDYLMRVVVPSIRAYDDFYKRLIAQVPISNVSSFFAMEEIKYTTALPLSHVGKDNKTTIRKKATARQRY
ncbi:MAG: Lrp/AsnC family transcriptional regulator [Pseudomonadota bacterium]